MGWGKGWPLHVCVSVSGDGNKGCQEHGTAKALAYLAYNLMSARQVVESMSCPVGSGEGRERIEGKIRLVQMGNASSSHWNRAVNWETQPEKLQRIRQKRLEMVSVNKHLLVFSYSLFCWDFKGIVLIGK